MAPRPTPSRGVPRSLRAIARRYSETTFARVAMVSLPPKPAGSSFLDLVFNTHRGRIQPMRTESTLPPAAWDLPQELAKVPSNVIRVFVESFDPRGLVLPVISYGEKAELVKLIYFN